MQEFIFDLPRNYLYAKITLFTSNFFFTQLKDDIIIDFSNGLDYHMPNKNIDIHILNHSPERDKWLNKYPRVITINCHPNHLKTLYHTNILGNRLYHIPTQGTIYLTGIQNHSSLRQVFFRQKYILTVTKDSWCVDQGKEDRRQLENWCIDKVKEIIVKSRVDA